MLTGQYNEVLVAISLLVAVLSAYTALGLADRIRAARGPGTRYWLLGSGVAMGVGIWSMHFVGMLAFSLPIPLGYDVSRTILSLVAAIACSAFAFWVGCRDTLPRRRLAAAALVMGVGISAMHYVGMDAMQMQPAIIFEPWLVALSAVIAVTASAAALWLIHRHRQDHPGVRRYRAAAALAMGLAVVGMHFTGMASASFPLNSICLASNSGISAGWMATSVTILCLGVLAIAWVVAVLDARLETRTAALASSLADANEELVQLALHDTLTKLPNRVLLEERLQQAIAQRQESGGHFAVIFVDLDGFKGVNDVYGHHTGDALLTEMAQRTKRVLRSRDSVARVGGDEFVVLAPVNEPADAAAVAQRLVEALSQPADLAGQFVSVTASAGIAVYPEDGRDSDTLLTNADAAMYHAKRTGRAGFSFFEPSMNANAQENLLLVQDLRLAGARNELEVYYQPKFIAPSGPVIGAEALLRWNHPTRGVIAPDVFIPIAERTGMIIPIGQWVIDQACGQLRQWRDMGHTGWKVSVNLSAMQFAHEDLVDNVRQILGKHELPGACLVLEVTESTAMRDVQASLTVLQKLVDLGVSISIDDFGTGYSSLLYLKRLPAAELKIDRGFINQLERDSEDAAIVSAIVALGQQLNLKVVAEGVETAEQQAFLTNLGCNSLQGFLLGRPVPARQFLEAHADVIETADAKT